MKQYLISLRKYFVCLTRLSFAYFTWRAVWLHIFSWIWLIDSTRWLAVYVLGVSQFFLFWRPGWIYRYWFSWTLVRKELFFHWLPIFLVPIDWSIEWVWIIIVFSFVYLWVQGVYRAFIRYRYMLETIQSIMIVSFSDITVNFGQHVYYKAKFMWHEAQEYYDKHIKSRYK